jgi:hypothetical protein
MDHITRRITTGTHIMVGTGAAIHRDTDCRPDTTPQTTTRRRRSMLRHRFTHLHRSMRLRRSIRRLIRATACRASIWTGTVTQGTVIPATATTVGTDMDTGDMVTGTVDMAITKRQVLQNAARTATGGDFAHRLLLATKTN